MSLKRLSLLWIALDVTSRVAMFGRYMLWYSQIIINSKLHFSAGKLLIENLSVQTHLYVLIHQINAPGHSESHSIQNLVRHKLVDASARNSVGQGSVPRYYGIRLTLDMPLLGGAGRSPRLSRGLHVCVCALLWERIRAHSAANAASLARIRKDKEIRDAFLMFAKWLYGDDVIVVRLHLVSNMWFCADRTDTASIRHISA